MKIPHDLYERVFDLATKLTDARETGDAKEFWERYNELRKFCEAQEAAGATHPFLWETLADYTDDDSAAIALYSKALKAAQNASAAEYLGSIQFALAERHKAMGNGDIAYRYALAANETAKHIDDLELRRTISEFLLNEAKGNE
jgi:hypothetical protein